MQESTKKHLGFTLVAMLGLGLAVSLGTVAATEALAPPSPADVAGITVSGKATAKAAPDRAEVTLGLEAQGVSAAEAQRKNAGTMERVIAALLGAGVERKDIQTTTYNLTPVRRWDRKAGRDVLVGYQATNLVTVTTGQTGTVGRLIDAAVAAGANNVQNVAFEVADQAGVQEKVLERAVSDARRKAEQMARAAGVRLGKVRTMADSTVELPPAWRQAKFLTADLGVGARQPVTPFEPGEVGFSTTVQVTFSIR